MSHIAPLGAPQNYFQNNESPTTSLLLLKVLIFWSTMHVKSISWAINACKTRLYSNPSCSTCTYTFEHLLCPCNKAPPSSRCVLAAQAKSEHKKLADEWIFHLFG